MLKILAAAAVCALVSIHPASASDWEIPYCKAQYKGKERAACLSFAEAAKQRPFGGSGMGNRGYLGRCGAGAC